MGSLQEKGVATADTHGCFDSVFGCNTFHDMNMSIIWAGHLFGCPRIINTIVHGGLEFGFYILLLRSVGASSMMDILLVR